MKDEVQEGQWNQIAVVFQWPLALTYLNGNFQNGVLMSLSLKFNSSSYDFQIGRLYDRYYHGYLDDFRIYNYKMTESELLSMYESVQLD